MAYKFMAFDELLAELEAEMPVKREVQIEGFNTSVWVWRLEPSQLIEVAETPHDSAQEVIEFTLKLVAYSVGDENGPGLFASDRGEAWLRRNPQALLALGRVCREFNELAAPDDERKKKSEQPATE